ncbi:MAG: hypothetical protein ACYTFA_13895, partial [Planctomycetota bacterium]
MQRALSHPVSVLGRQAEDVGGADPFDVLKSVRERLDESYGVCVEDSLGVIGPDENDNGVLGAEFVPDRSIKADFGGVCGDQGVPVGPQLKVENPRRHHHRDQNR